MTDSDNQDDKSGSKPAEEAQPTSKLSVVEKHRQWLLDHGAKIRKLEKGEAIVWFPNIR